MPARRFHPKTETCRKLIDIWSEARGEAQMPRRTDMDPSRLRPILSQVAIITIVSPGINEIRLAGSDYRDIFGFEPTARNLVAVTQPEARRWRAYRFFMCATHPCGGVAILNLPYRNGITDRFELLGLPLEADSPGQPRSVVCAIASILGRRWQADTTDQMIGGYTEAFQFFDIGAGIPASIDPPDDFTIE